MKSKTILNKLTSPLLACAFILLSGSAFACYPNDYYSYDYYPNACYTGCCYSCNGCYYEYNYHYMRFSSPHRHNYAKSEFETSSYEWVGDP